MATNAIFTLRQLRCISEGDGTGHSEPYIWPVLLWVTDATIVTPETVGLSRQGTGAARVVIRQDMRAGEAASIPAPVGVLRLRLDEESSFQRLFMVVALWEADETPIAAARAGYLAFADETRAAIAQRLFALSNATEEQTQFLQEEIRNQVTAAVRSAIFGALSGWQKTRILAGSLNLDDTIGGAFVTVAELTPRSFVMSFGAGTSNAYEIDGGLEVRRVRVDRCQGQVDAVRAARISLESAEQSIAELQSQLHSASPVEKEEINDEIAEIRNEELPIAEEALELALARLAACRRIRQIPESILAEVSTNARQPTDATDPQRSGSAQPKVLRGERGEIAAVTAEFENFTMVAIPKTPIARRRAMSDNEFDCLRKCMGIENLEQRLNCILRCPASRNYEVLIG